MRNWLFHPLLFYPLCALIAGALIVFSLQPQKWPRQPAQVAGQTIEGALVLEAAAFDSPDTSPEQVLTVVRDFWGAPEALRIAVLPSQPAPTPAETGVRILLTPESAALIGERAVTAEVTYNAVSVNPASGLAVSLQGIAPADWVTQTIPPQPGVVSFDLPASFEVNAIGLRALSTGTDQSYGVEILSIRLIPQGS